MVRLTFCACLVSLGAWAQTPEPAEAPQPAEAPPPAQTKPPAEAPQPAQTKAPPQTTPAPDKNVKHRDAQTLIEEGQYLPNTFAARIGDQRVLAMAFGGYDTNDNQGGVFQGVIEGALFNRVALRVGYDYLAAGSVSVGVRLGLLRQELQGIDLGFFIQYKQLGFSEPNGEVEMALTASRRWGRWGRYGSLVYGQGIHREERDGEVRLAFLCSLKKRYNVGLEARGRFDLGEGGGKKLAGSPPEAGFDLIAGPVGAISLGPVALLVEAGAHMMVLDSPNGGEENVSAGLIALAGAGAAF
jgi:hypothetical protein